MAVPGTGGGSNHRTLWSVRTAAGLFVLSLLVWIPLTARPQEEPAPAASAADEKPKADEAEATPASGEDQEAEEPTDQKKVKSYPVENGTLKYGRTEEIQKKKTADGEVETRRVRAPNYGGDPRLLYESETRTRKLPDGTIERERILRNPDGSGRMVPIEIIKERTRSAGETTTTDREVLKQDSTHQWQPVRKERVTETGEEKSRQSVTEVRERNLSGDWKLVDRTVASEKGNGAETSVRSVRQTPDAHGGLADYEVREETRRKDGDKETTEVNVRRRDTQETNNPKFFLVERSRVEQRKTADGKVTRKSVTESDLVADGASRNVTPGAPKVVEEKVEEETSAADGSTRRTVTVKERGAANRELRSSGQIVQQTDSKGNVRQIFIPSQ